MKGHRFCVDFRALNNITKSLANSLLLIDHIRALLGNSANFSTVDLRSEYWLASSLEWGRSRKAACHVELNQFRLANGQKSFNNSRGAEGIRIVRYSLPWLHIGLFMSISRMETNCLGITIDRGGIQPDIDTVEVIRAKSEPHVFKEGGL